MSHTFSVCSDFSDVLIGKKKLVIAGIEVYAYYFKDHSTPFDFNPPKGNGETLKLLYLMHGRERSAETSEELAKALLKKYYSISPEATALVVLTYDHRNHGRRVVNSERNWSWGGNRTHAPDMLSMIEGAVVDLTTIHDYFPSYAPFYKNFKKVIHLVSGVSMGGHAAIKVTVKYPGLFDGAAPIVGCFDLTSLLLNRLKNFEKTTLYKEPYSALKLEYEEAFRYPEALFKLSSKEDSQTEHFYDTEKLKTFALFGKDDPLVPLNYSQPFLKRHNQIAKSPEDFDESVQFQAIKYRAKHEVTEEMVIDLARWLVHF